MQIDLDREYEYILESDRKTKTPTVWLLKEMTCGVSNIISNECTAIGANGKTKILTGEVMKIQMQHCVVGWRNFTNTKGEEIVYADELKDKLPAWVQSELSREINRLSSPSREEVKN